MITRKTIVWLIAAVCVAVALMLWLSPLGPSNLPVIIAGPGPAEAVPMVARSESNTHADTQRPVGLTVHNATAEELGRLGEAVTAFSKAKLELPTLDIAFYSDHELCDEHYGLFRATPEPWQIRICSSDIGFVYEHELAHAWVTANVDEETRSAFMNLRGLSHWADSNVPWNQRGTEWAAVVIQQGLSGLPLPPVLSNEAKSRLESYELLTGGAAPVLVNWIKERDVPCSDRPTDLSRPIADRTGRTCASSPSPRGPQLIDQKVWFSIGEPP
ncbi:MAG: hypothetical protein ACRDWA_10175 [Acidimicrobiia bacterium]